MPLSQFVPKVYFEQIRIKDLVSNQDYQRNISISNVKRAADNFDLYQINPVKVSRRNGINYVFNGQHTIEIVALVSGSRETPVWCMIYDDLEYTQEADIFANQLKYTKALTPYEIFNANIEAGNDKQLMIQDLVESFGLKIAHTKTPGAICAISTLESILDKYGLESRGKASKGCDLFISLHSNAVGSYMNESVDRVVAYVMLDGSSTAVGKKLADCVAEVMATQQSPQVKTREGNRGEYYGVLRGAASVGTPGIILEHSFHTQTKATRWLLEDDNLQKLAVEEAKVIAAYFGVSKPEGEPERWYRIRKSWEDAGSQLGAYKDLTLAKEHCPLGYTIFDNDGKPVYTPANVMAWWQGLGLDVPSDPISGETLVEALYGYHNAINK